MSHRAEHGQFLREGRGGPPPATWVSGTLEEWTDAPDGGAPSSVAAKLVRGEDGSLGFFGWTLRSVQAACAFSIVGKDPAYRCHPLLEGSIATSEYLDNACTEPFVSSSASGRCAIDTAKVAARSTYDGDACYPKLTAKDYFLIGAECSGRSLSEGDGWRMHPHERRRLGGVPRRCSRRDERPR